ARIAAGVGQHGHEGGQNGELEQQSFETLDDQPGDQAENGQDDDPGDAVSEMGPGGCTQVFARLVATADRHELLDVLLLLLANHVHDVVVCDDADELAVPVDDGNGQQIVLLDLMSHRLLVVADVGADDILVHNVADLLGGSGENQVLQGDQAD